METESNASEDGYSTNSSLASGLTGYEDEINEIKNILKLSTTPVKNGIKRETYKKSTTDVGYEIRISKLNLELQNALKLNEKYKNELFEFERRSELESHEKFEKLVKKNAVLQAQLNNANLHIGKLFKNGESKIQNNGNFEKINYELELKIGQLRDQLEHFKNETSSLSANNKALNLQVNELRLDVNVKQNCIDELKKKIVEQHTENQHLFRENVKLSNNVSKVDNEVCHLQKSVKWYKEQLHNCQNEKNKVVEEFLALKTVLINKNKNIENLDSEIRDWKGKYRELCDNYGKNEEIFSKKIAQLEIDILNASQINNSEAPESPSNKEIDSVKNFYEAEIENLKSELQNIQRNIFEQTLLFDKIRKENSELLSRNAVMQKELNDKVLKIDILENSKTESIHKYDEIKKLMRVKEDEVLLLKTENCKLVKVAESATREKESISNAIEFIRIDFQKFFKMYNDVKRELAVKTKDIIKLQQEKQELFMNNNWTGCEIEEFKHKEKEYLKKISTLSNEKLEFSKVKRDLEDKIGLLEKSVEEFSKSISELNLEKNGLIKENMRISSLEREVDSLKRFVEDSEHKISFYKRSIVELNSEIDSFKLEIKDYKNVFNDLYKNMSFLISGNVANIFSVKRSNSKKNLEITSQLDNYLVQLVESYKNYKNEDTEEYVKTLEVSNEKLNANRNRFLEFKRKLVDRLSELENKVSLVSTKCQESANTMQTYLSRSQNLVGKEVTGEEILNLQTALKVKDLLLEEKQKKYEISNRTLLKKIKEHMRGRNKAEKHCEYLQDMYNSTMESLNTTKLELGQKEFLVDELKTVLDSKNNRIEKLQVLVTSLEQQVASVLICPKCIDKEKLQESLDAVEKNLELAESKVVEFCNDSRAKEQTILKLQQQIHELYGEKAKLEEEHIRCSYVYDELVGKLTEVRDKFEMVSIEIEDKMKIIESLKDDCANYQVQQSDCENNLKIVNLEVKELKEKNSYYIKEIEMMSCNITNKDEEIENLLAQKCRMEEELKTKERNLKEILKKSDLEVDTLQNNIEMLNSEKYFLQRLTNDLKVALNNTSKENQALKYKISVQLKDRRYNSLPLNLPSPSPFDESKINQLLERANMSSEKSLTKLHDCLNSLKKEMACLQQQIAEQKFTASSL